MFSTLDAREQERLRLQVVLDAEKSQDERNRLGQFATPSSLAEEILSYGLSLLPSDARISFLDPAMGTGAFYAALLKCTSRARLAEARGFERDPHYGRPAQRLWSETGLELQLADFTRAEPAPRFNLLICNPPYVRHHHLDRDDKVRLQRSTAQASGIPLSGLAGLYCYFLGLSHAWMAAGAVAGWLIPSEFMDVNYGQAVKQYLLSRVTMLHIHRFDPRNVQFTDALVSSAVVWFKNEPPPPDHPVTFSLGGTLLKPEHVRTVSSHALAQERKWTRFPQSECQSPSRVPTLSRFFKITRGIATGDNSFFILSEEALASRSLPKALFTPILPSPRQLHQDEVGSRQDGSPDLEPRLFLLDTNLPEEALRRQYPTLAAYLEEGKARGLPERYLCKHRSLWYSQERRPAAPLVCTYLGRGESKRGRPFRFILNASRATVTNVYLALYPTPPLAGALEHDPTLLRHIWSRLNVLAPEVLLGEGRVYGGGLHKLEPRELGHVPAEFILELLAGISPLPSHPARAAACASDSAGTAAEAVCPHLQNEPPLMPTGNALRHT